VITKTKGIVLKSYPFGDSGLIVKIYTEDFGLLSFLAQGVKKTNAKNSSSTYMPLQVVEIVFYLKDDEQLKKIKEINLINHSQAKYIQPLKLSIVIFMSEVVFKSVHDHVKDAKLFNYIRQMIEKLDVVDDVHHFPLEFLSGLFVYLGIQPKLNFNESNKFFNLEEGVFEVGFHKEKEILNEASSAYFYKINNIEERNAMELFKYADRVTLLDNMIKYLKVHVLHNKSIESVEVLHEIM